MSIQTEYVLHVRRIDGKPIAAQLYNGGQDIAAVTGTSLREMVAVFERHGYKVARIVDIETGEALRVEDE